MTAVQNSDERTDKALFHLLALGGYIFLLVGLVFLVLGTAFFLSARKKADTYVETEAVIVGFDREGYPYVTYTAHGRTYEQRSSYTSSSLEVGQEMTVRYDPQDPTKMTVGGKAAWLLPGLFLGLGGLFFVLGAAWVTLVYRKFRPKDENPWANREP